jgi:hypothetical protein
MSDLVRRQDALAIVQEWTYCSDVEDLVRALPAVRPRVKPLVWHKSHIKPWREDWHTVPTGYTVRCADEWGWKWTSPLGAHGYENTPDIAKAAAQADYNARILSALDNSTGKETK